jgi:type I restriction enzyme M protein
MRGELEEVLQALMKKNGITFFNMSGLSLKKLLNAPDHIGDSFKTTQFGH